MIKIMATLFELLVTIRTNLRVSTSENFTLQVQFATTLLEHSVTMIGAKGCQIKQLITNQHKTIMMYANVGEITNNI